MAIEVAADHAKHGWVVEILVSAEHKHDFVARETSSTPESAMDLCVHKIEHQLRRYKERVQHHKGDVTHGGPPARSSGHLQAPEAAHTEPDEL
jgi:putative sigma-54 modulation protein